MMHEHSCVEVRERLDAFHDGELSVHDRIDIQRHLDECVTCNLEANELVSISTTLRELTAQVTDD